MKFFVLLFIGIVSLLQTSTAMAAEGLVTCTGGDECNFCSFVSMVNGLIEWLIIVAVTLTVLLLAFAGFRLVTSAGDAAGFEQAKKIFVSSIIGIMIMLAGWTIVDTVLKITAGGDLGVWNAVECGGAYEVAPAVDIDIALKIYEWIGVAPDEEVTLHTGGHVGIDGETLSILDCSVSTSQFRTISFLGTSVQIHESLVPSLQRIDAKWRAQSNRYRVQTVLGVQCRNVAGTNRRSNHAYGIAMDINPSQNPFCPNNAACGGRNILITDMPPEFVALFTSEGWGWGGNWNSSKDAMHFSKAPGEGGNGQY